MKYLKDLWQEFDNQEKWIGSEFYKYERKNSVFIVGHDYEDQMSSVSQDGSPQLLFIVSNEIDLETLAIFIKALR